MSGSYIPLYRKYRPGTFSDLVGQEAVVKTLTNAIQLNKIAHAYLFTGSRGTGKTSSARILAKALNCEKGPTPEPCGICSSCIDITNGNAIDVIEIDAASNRKVEDARTLLEKVHFAPVAGKFKIYIIDEVHMLTTEAFNTLLKTLEEPPQNLVFILATTEAHKVLNTIISRCQRFDFRRIKNDLIKTRLKDICKTEKLNINDQALSIIAKRSAGGLRDALSLLDQVSILANIQDEVTEKDIITLLGSMPEEILSKIADSIAQKDTKRLLSLIDEITGLGSEPVQVIRELIGYFRNIMLTKASGNVKEIKEILTVGEAIYEDISKQAEIFEGEELAQIIEKLSQLEKTIKSSSQQHLWLEVGLIGICHRNGIHVIKDLEDRIAKLESAILTGNIPAARQPVRIEKPTDLLTEVTLPAEVKIEQKQETPKQTATPEMKPEPVKQEIPAVQSIEEDEPPQIIEEQKEIPTPIQTETVKPQTNSGNITENWKALLSGIESTPSRMFFFNLSKPVEISPDRIVITFIQESFIKQAQDKSKYEPLERAAQRLFGNLPRIIIRTPLPEDEKIRQEAVKPIAVPPAEKKTPIIPTKPSEKTEIEVAKIPEPIAEMAEDDVITQMENISKGVERINLSEQAKMVVELFNGKIIE